VTPTRRQVLCCTVIGAASSCVPAPFFESLSLCWDSKLTVSVHLSNFLVVVHSKIYERFSSPTLKLRFRLLRRVWDSKLTVSVPVVDIVVASPKISGNGFESPNSPPDCSPSSLTSFAAEGVGLETYSFSPRSLRSLRRVWDSNPHTTFNRDRLAICWLTIRRNPPRRHYCTVCAVSFQMFWVM
jgi:hypothetical protein